MQSKNTNNHLVYSSEQGRICPSCSQPIKMCRCKTSVTPVKTDGFVRIQRETKGRKGKGVTLITDLSLPADELKKLAKNLKQKCGTGGTIKNGIIEIQGDHRQTLSTELQNLGWKVKLVGG
jgi:translation initiation factor 1